MTDRLCGQQLIQLLPHRLFIKIIELPAKGSHRGFVMMMRVCHLSPPFRARRYLPALIIGFPSFTIKHINTQLG